MKRREFIAGLAGAAARPIAARAQQLGMPVIGFLQSGSLEATAHTRAAFHRGLRDGGYIEGHNVEIIYRYADGQYDRLPSLAADLISNNVVAIFAGGPPATRAAKEATTTKPIIFTTGDPVKSGLVASLNRPGGNLTGVAFFAALLGAKQSGLLRELVPNAVTIGMLVNPNFPEAATTVADGQAAARAAGLELQVFHTSNEGELEAAFADMKKGRIDAVVVVADIYTHFDGEAARKAGIPFIGVLCGGSSERQLTDAGALAIYKNPAHLLIHYATSPICQPIGSRQ